MAESSKSYSKSLYVDAPCTYRALGGPLFDISAKPRAQHAGRHGPAARAHAHTNGPRSAYSRHGRLASEDMNPWSANGAAPLSAAMRLPPVHFTT